MVQLDVFSRDGATDITRALVAFRGANAKIGKLLRAIKLLFGIPQRLSGDSCTFGDAWIILPSRR